LGVTPQVLGDRKSFKEIAELYEKAYGEKINLLCLGSLDDLNKAKEQARAAHPDDMRAWISL